MPLLSPAINLDPNPAKGNGGIIITDDGALVSIDGPSGSGIELEATPQSSQISIYTVRSGDTLSEIAEMFNVSVSTIIWANDIKDRYIRPGDVLVILPITGLRYSVKEGDTIASIAKKYEGDEYEIASYNELDKNEALTIGDTVFIPNGVIATVPTKVNSSETAVSAPVLQGTENQTQSGYYMRPVTGGVRTQGIHGYNGIDIGAPSGTPIYAAAAGNVIIARGGGAWNGGYGNYVVIQHNNGTQTLYAHATTIYVSVGNSVTQGEQIATVGRTGQSTGDHLHFEVRGAANPF